jgi:hypothetical protein
VETSGPFTTRGITLGNPFREVVAILLQSAAGVEVGFLGAVRDGCEVTDAEVNTSRLVAGGGGRLDFVFADEVKFPSSLRFILDRANLLQILNRDFGARLVLDEDVL